MNEPKKLEEIKNAIEQIRDEVALKAGFERIRNIL